MYIVTFINYYVLRSSSSVKSKVRSQGRVLVDQRSSRIFQSNKKKLTMIILQKGYIIIIGKAVYKRSRYFNMAV